MPTADLAPLVAFGEEADRGRYAAIDRCGVIVPGGRTAPFLDPGKEEANDERTAREAEEAGPTARSRSRSRRPQAEAAASGPAAHALGELRANWQGNGITSAELEELDYWYPDVRVVASSSRIIYLALTSRLFRTLPFRARLVLEVPRPDWAAATMPFVPWRHPGRFAAALDRALAVPWVRNPEAGMPVRFVPMVPAIRAWAAWFGGAMHGAMVISHHRYSDLAICACMPHQWIRGIHPLVDYVSMCVSWLGKMLHERELGRYPGPQHYPEYVRVSRDRPDEFCGCGAMRRYTDCHRDGDLAISVNSLRVMGATTYHAYYADLARQGRAGALPRRVWCEALSR
jgi:hypothetical protein